MFNLSSALVSRIADRHGVVTTDELIADGIGLSTIRRAVSARVLVRIHNGVYRFAISAESFEARCVQRRSQIRVPSSPESAQLDSSSFAASITRTSPLWLLPTTGTRSPEV